VFTVCVIGLTVCLGIWLAWVLRGGASLGLEILLVAAFVFHLPTVVIAFVNSAIGFLVMRVSATPLQAVSPVLTNPAPLDQINLRVAVAMTVRNEDPARALRHLEAVMVSLQSDPISAQFHCHVLSDSDDHAVIRTEDAHIAAWRARATFGEKIFLRRRDTNTGFKGGNVHDFCERSRDMYDVVILLDTDSLMARETLLQIVRIMQRHPRLGILQTFAVGLPTSSLFARIFQFGHRMGMRCFIYGAAWWQGDCCQFWGHNCAIRIAPFADFCKLPILPGNAPFGGHIICHDQLESALMRRAGYEVRFHPEECKSWEGNPPTLADFVKRNGRWCLGNLQNLRLLFDPGFVLATRFHLAYMAQKFFSGVCFLFLVTVAVIASATWPEGPVFPSSSAHALYFAWLLLFFSPRVLGTLEILLSGPARYGGFLRFITGEILEIAFNFFLLPVTMFAAAQSMVSLLFARIVRWDGQHRDGHRLSWRAAGKMFWPQTLYGVAMLIACVWSAPSATLWFLPFLTGLICSIPFAVVTSVVSLGQLAARQGICAMPEEFIDEPEIVAVSAGLQL
jgi:membrane glycosyltransferase